MEFIRKEIRNLLPGDIVLHPIYRQDGLILIRRYKQVTHTIIQHLRTHCDDHMPVLVVEQCADIAALVQFVEANHEALMQALQEVCAQQRMQYSMHHTSVHLAPDHLMPSHRGAVNPAEFGNTGSFIHDLTTSPGWIGLGNAVVAHGVQERADATKQDVLNGIANDDKLSTLLCNLGDYHDVLRTHSINTTCISLAIGLSLELPTDHLVQLAFATLLADIGYTVLAPEEFLDILTHQNRHLYVAEHIRKSIEIIEVSTTCREKSLLMGILDHHERMDGSGAPNHKHGDEISLFGRIIAIAQAYDELAGGYIGGHSYSVFQAQLMVWNNRGTKWDADILHTFFHRRSYCKVGQTVTLAGSLEGTIIGFTNFAAAPLAPIVQLVNGDTIDFYAMGDLTKILSIA